MDVDEPVFQESGGSDPNSQLPLPDEDGEPEIEEQPSSHLPRGWQKKSLVFLELQVRLTLLIVNLL